MRRSSLFWLVAITLAALVAHMCGYAFGVANQATYFLQPLHHAHPELLRHDWLVTSTSEYHSVFAIVGGLLFRIDDTGVTAFGIVNFMLMVVLVCGLAYLVRGTTERVPLQIFVLVLGWLAVNGEHSVAGSYLWSWYLQPSLIASAGWMIALSMHVRGRPLATGIALAAAGLFHVNFLLLGIGVFALEELINDGPRRARRLALLLVPQLFAVALVAPEIFAHASGADPDHALWVLVQFHAPVHYKAYSILWTLPSLLRWVALAIVVAPIAIAFGHGTAVRRLVWWSAIAGVVCAATTFIVMIPPLMALTRLYVWRLAPFSIVAAQVVIAIAVAATITDPSCWREQAIWRRVVAVVLAVWIAARTPFMQAADADWVLFASLVAVAVAIAIARAWALTSWPRSVLLAVVAATTLAAPLWYARVELLHPTVGVNSDGDEGGLYTWAGTSSPVDSVFLTPPDLYRFRLLARRAIYADFKSPPLTPDGLIEWHARLCRMDNALLTEKIPAHRQHWLDATGDELLARARQLGVDFLVLDRTPSHDRTAARPVYSNSSFAVYAVRE